MTIVSPVSVGLFRRWRVPATAQSSTSQRTLIATHWRRSVRTSLTKSMPGLSGPASIRQSPPRLLFSSEASSWLLLASSSAPALSSYALSAQSVQNVLLTASKSSKHLIIILTWTHSFMRSGHTSTSYSHLFSCESVTFILFTIYISIQRVMSEQEKMLGARAV